MEAVKAERVPEPVVMAKLITWPSATGFPNASITCARNVLMVELPAVRLLGVAVRLIALGGPAINVTTTLAAAPPAVAVIVAKPMRVALIRLTEALPSSVVAFEAERRPAVVEKLTTVGLVMGFPFVSFTSAVISVLVVPPAMSVCAFAVRTIEPTTA